LAARIAFSAGLTGGACGALRSRLALLAILPSLAGRARWSGRACGAVLALHAALAVAHHRQAFGHPSVDARQCLDLGRAQVGERRRYLRLARGHLRLEQLADAGVVGTLARHHLAEDFRQRVRR